MIDLAMIAACAVPGVAPETLEKVITVESAGDPLAINVNGKRLLLKKPRSKNEAIHQAKSLVAGGYSVDLGLMQINSANLAGYETSIDKVFDPCTNIKVGSAILKSFYDKTVIKYGEGQTALKAALSAYNTGNFQSGYRNGYVRNFYKGKPVRFVFKDTEVNFNPYDTIKGDLDDKGKGPDSKRKDD